jgi:hypothetical protein
VVMDVRRAPATMPAALAATTGIFAAHRKAVAQSTKGWL